MSDTIFVDNIDLTKSIVLADRDTRTTFDCKGKTNLYMPGTWSSSIDTIQNISTKGSNLYLTVNVVVGVDRYGDEIRKNIKLTFKNYDSIENVYCADKHYEFNEKRTYNIANNYIDYFIEDSLVMKAKGKTITATGTKWGDSINIDASVVDPEEVGINIGDDDDYEFEPTKYKYTINAGDGKNNITLINAYNSNNISAGSSDDEITLADTSDTTIFSRAVTTVKAGNGTNTINISGSGKNSIITGIGNDVFNFDNGTNTTTVKAGGGTNTININDDSFGNIVIEEEKIKNTANNIVFGSGVTISDITKINNDLILSNDNSTLKLNNYFMTGGNYSSKKLGDSTDLATFLTDNSLKLNVSGTGTIKGTSLDENIRTSDSLSDYSGRAKNDKIYAGKGADTINAGLGKNSIYLYTGDGIKTIENGGGADTLVFAKGTSVKIEYTNTNNTDTKGNYIYNMTIYYGKNSDEFTTNYVVMNNAVILDKTTKNYSLNTSVKSLKIGSKTYALDALTNKNKIENVLSNGYVIGTKAHDEIYVTDSTTFDGQGNVKIVGNAGSDTIMIGNNISDKGDDSQNIYAIDNTNDYNYNPSKYKIRDIKPIVFTHTEDGMQDTNKKVSDRIVSYATGDGTFWAQSANNYIESYGWHTDGSGTNDTYKVYYNNQFTKICDEAGTNDALNILDKNHDELKLIFSLSKNYKDFSGDNISNINSMSNNDLISLIANSLQEVKIVTESDRKKFLKNPNKNSNVGIDIDYWGNKGIDSDSNSTVSDNEKITKLLNLDRNTIAKFGNGIEKITTKDNYYITSADIANIASEVANWLNTDSTYGAKFDNIQDVVGNKNAMASVLAVFDEALANAWKPVE